LFVIRRLDPIDGLCSVCISLPVTNYDDC